MSKKRDPIVAVLHYFETADLPLAEQALSLARAAVQRRRSTKPAAAPASKPKVTKTLAEAVAN